MSASNEYVTDGVDFNQVKRVLIIKLRHHGDVLITSPMFTALKEQFPHLEIDALVYLDTASMLEFHPHLSQLHTIDRQWKKLGIKGQIREEWSLIKRLKERQYDVVFHMTDHWRGLTLVKFLKPKVSITQIHPRRTGSFWKKSFDYNYPVNFKKRHMVEKHLDALRRLGVYPSTESKRMIAIPGEEAESKVKSLLADAGLEPGQYIHIHPTSRWLFKSWDVDKMAAVINQLQAKGYPLVVTAAPDRAEMRMMDAILAQVEKPVVNLCGKINLKELMALIQHARLLIGVDSVPMHIASATNTPCVAFFGPSNELEWSPWMNRHIILSSNHSCRPCDLAGCGDGRRSECLSSITVERALSAVETLLS
ncbi:putative lipopolysaccharide heptosyltransferase III [Hahella sp. CCB-MM4]|uniref:putative lipopolysaccharide heptosyltransferase III n=1 Tax=Hahella sp. (strain CCB-MM4) TaxID=1926491 RepID=UPI000B9C275E|nr:putative lipopolysaccharide heptosyltransferase III [Hahella sp. CCB-MM4]OZG74913.1 putative lipopolysaccharide heptosyltransferase III [Hahella sp. CCB-MM4]